MRASGQFWLALPSGTHSIRVKATEERRHRLFGAYSYGTLNTNQVLSNHTKEVCHATNQITGRVTNNLGRPLTNLPVQAFSERISRSWVTRTDTNGCYEFPVMSGKWRIEPDCDAFLNVGYSTAGAQVVEVSGADTNVDFALTFPPRLRLATACPSTSGYILWILADPGQTWRVERSTNLVDWQMFEVITMDACGGGLVQDTYAPVFPQRFYRASILP